MEKQGEKGSSVTRWLLGTEAEMDGTLITRESRAYKLVEYCHDPSLTKVLLLLWYITMENCSQ